NLTTLISYAGDSHRRHTTARITLEVGLHVVEFRGLAIRENHAEVARAFEHIHRLIVGTIFPNQIAPRTRYIFGFRQVRLFGLPRPRLTLRRLCSRGDEAERQQKIGSQSETHGRQYKSYKPETRGHKARDYGPDSYVFQE